MLKLITNDKRGQLWELHKADCRDLAKKADSGIEVNSIEEAKLVVEGENDILIAENDGDEEAGYYFDRDVKVFSCVSVQ